MSFPMLSNIFRNLRPYLTAAVCSLFLAFSLTSCRTSHKGAASAKGKGDKENAISHIHVDEKNKRGAKIVKEAMEWIGTPYKYASSDKGEGTDCSGMVMATYLEVTGIKLPRNSAKQAEFCELISPDKVR
ncbi:MAG: C40 family peptidase, partial [Muribaculaceae bacterium]|nr:C40 family peptidase [Muribaculaceae bacterium]